MPTTPISGLRYPALSNNPDVPQDLANLAADVDSKLVPRFADTAARSAAITAPVNGQVAAVGSMLTQRRGTAWRTVGICKARRTVATAFGTLAAGVKVGIVASATMPAAPFGPGVPYMLLVLSQIQAEVPSGAGGRVLTSIGGTTYRSDQQGNAASSTGTITFRGHEVALVSVDTAQTVFCELEAISGTLDVTSTGGEVSVIAIPYEAL